MNKYISVGVGCILLGAIGWFIWQAVLNTNDGEDVSGANTCTMEALICPDGSLVGRSGPACAMEACPTMDFIEGELVVRDGGYWLITASPEEAMEATYILPLQELGDSSSSLVGQQVRVQGTFSEGNTLTVSMIEVLSGEKTVGTVGVGETVFINGVKITLLEVLQDNRCPSDAQCIEGGGITASFTLVSDTDTVTRNIASDEVPTPFDAYTIEIEEIAPARMSAGDPAQSDYKLTLRVVNIND